MNSLSLQEYELSRTGLLARLTLANNSGMVTFLLGPHTYSITELISNVKDQTQIGKQLIEAYHLAISDNNSQLGG